MVIASSARLSAVVCLACSLVASPAAAQQRRAQKPAQKAEGGDKKAAPAASTPAPAAPPPAAPPEEPIAKRGIYVALDLGFSRVDLAGFSGDLGLDKKSANGSLYGIGAGVRLDKLRLGARFRVHDTTEFTMGTILAEAGYGLDLRPIEPVLFVRAGYAGTTSVERATYASSLPPLNTVPPDVRVRGALVGVEASASYVVGEMLRVGPFIGFDALFMGRPQVDLPQSLIQINSDVREKPLYTGSGSGFGYAFDLGIRGTLDFGF